MDTLIKEWMIMKLCLSSWSLVMLRLINLSNDHLIVGMHNWRLLYPTRGPAWCKKRKSILKSGLMNYLESDRLAWWNIAAFWYMRRSLCQHLANPFSSWCPFASSPALFFCSRYTFWYSQWNIVWIDWNDSCREKNDLINITN